MGTLKRVQAILTKNSQVNRSVLRFSKNINEDGWLSDVSLRKTEVNPMPRSKTLTFFKYNTFRVCFIRLPESNAKSLTHFTKLYN